MPAATDPPAALLRDFLLIDDALQVEHYNAALAAIGAPKTTRTRFHVDAAGYSPEVAAELGSPLYLSPGVLRAHALIVAVEQLGAPLVHPGLGFAADAYRSVTAAHRREISRITTREPLIGEARDPATHLSAARQLADLSHVEVQFRTPGGLVRNARRLEALKGEFLQSDRRWLDDDFIREMAELAAEIRDLGALSHDFAASSHALGPFYAAAFGGSYVLEEPGASVRAATTYVLCAEPASTSGEEAKRRSARGRYVAVEPLEAATAAALLERHQVARLDVDALRSHPEILEGIAHWIAVDRLLASDPERPLAELAPRQIVERMLAEGDPPADFLELEEVGRRVRARRGRLDSDSLGPLTRTRLLTPSSTREPIRRFACHLRAFVDPVHLERAWHDAPDLFFARLPALSPGHRAYFAGWLEARSGLAGPRAR